MYQYKINCFQLQSSNFVSVGVEGEQHENNNMLPTDMKSTCLLLRSRHTSYAIYCSLDLEQTRQYLCVCGDKQNGAASRRANTKHAYCFYVSTKLSWCWLSAALESCLLSCSTIDYICVREHIIKSARQNIHTDFAYKRT